MTMRHQINPDELDGLGGNMWDHIGVRAIQFVAVATVVPAVVILAMQGLMQGETVAAILSGVIGYLLGNVSKFDDRADT